MFTLKIIFTGLIAFVPHPDGHGGFDKVWALLVNATGAPSAHPPCTSSKKASKLGLQPHVPYLRYFPKNHVSSDGVFFFPNLEGCTPLRLSSIDLRIDGALARPEEDSNYPETKGNVGVFSDPTLTTKVPADAKKDVDFRWVADVPAFAGAQRGKVSCKYLDDELSIEKDLDRLMSRVTIDRGRLAVRIDRADSLSGPGDPILYEIINPANKYERAMAESVELEVVVTGKMVRLDLMNFQTDKSTPIYLAPADGEKTVTIQILNDISSALNAPCGDHPSHSKADITADKKPYYDFRWFYHLTDEEFPKGGKCKSELPVPKKKDSQQNSPICPVAGMSQ